MKKGFLVFIILVLTGGIGLACRISDLTSGMMTLLPSGTPSVTSLPSQSPTSKSQIDRTSIIQTVIVQFTQTAIAALNTSTQTPSVPPLPVATLTPSFPTPFLETPTPIFVSTYVPVSQPCYWVGFVADITYPDGSILQANEVYLKTWRIVNLGTCAWVPGDQLIFSQGDRMGAPDAVSLVGAPLPPGGVVDISVYLRAPSYPGSYRANFRMRAMDGTIFGTGSQASGSLWSQIRVIPCCIPTPYGKADLDIKSFSVSPLITYFGMPVTATFTIKNKGEADAGPFTVVWLSGVNTRSRLPSPCTWAISFLPVGKIAGPYSCSMKYDKVGTYTTELIVDAEHQVPDSNPENNHQVINVKIITH